MKRINIILLDYIERKAKLALLKGDEKSFDSWADLWLEVLRKCPVRLREILTSSISQPVKEFKDNGKDGVKHD